jgi:hypothetical protein
MPGFEDTLGIESTSILSNEKTKILDDFLNDTDSVTGDPADVKPITKKEEEPKTDDKDKKPETPKADAKEIDNQVLGDEEKDDEGDSEDTEGDENEESTETDNQFEALSKELYKLNIFSSDTDDEGNTVMDIASTPEEFKLLFKSQSGKEVDRQLQSFLTNKHGEEGKRVFDAIFVDGVDPRDFYETYTELQDLGALDPKSEDDQEVILREFYGDKLPADKVNKLISRLRDVHELESHSEELLPQLVKQREDVLNQKMKDAEARTQRSQQLDNQYKNALTRTLNEKLKAKEFDGIPLSDQTVRAAYDFLYTKKFETPQGEKLTEFDVFIMESKKPENIANRIKIALLAQNKFDFSKIQKQAISKETNELFRFIEKKKPNKAAAPKVAADKNPTSSGWNELLK